MKYTCPMHPEVVQEAPGRCPKCGMALVVRGENLHIHGAGVQETTWKSYIPLVIVVAMILVVSVAIALNQGGLADNILENFMAGFFLTFGTFKLMDLKGFAAGYSTYDLLARKVFAYGYIYPFIELFFGISMIVAPSTHWILWAEVASMLFSGLGVAVKLAKREQFQCVCLGTFLRVPLARVTLVEDFGMAALALVMILR